MRMNFVVALMIAFMGSQSFAQTVLIDRNPDPNLLGGGIIGGVFSDRTGEDVSPLTQVTFSEPVTIGEVTVFATNLNAAFPDVGYPVGSSGQAVLNIFFGDTLSLAADTLSGGDFGLASTTVDYVSTAEGIEITASGLEIELPAAATYLIGLTPILNFETNGQEFFLDAGANGESTFLNNPGGALFVPIFGSETINANVLDLPVTYTGMAIRISALDGFTKGDVNGDGSIDLLDVAPFVDAIANGDLIPAADINCDGVVNLLDVGPFIDLLGG